MEGWCGGREGEFGVLTEGLKYLVDFAKSGFFGFVGDRETSEVSVRGEFLGASFW